MAEKFIVVEKPTGYYAVKQPKPGMRDALLDSLQSKGYEIVGEVAKTPSMKSLEKMLENGIAKAIDGCKVEPDGTCHHGKPSWMLVLGYI